MYDDQKCIYCGEDEISSIRYSKDDADYSCPKCHKHFDLKTAISYNKSSVWQKLMFRYLHYKGILKHNI